MGEPRVPSGLEDLARGASYSPAIDLPPGSELVPFSGIVDTLQEGEESIPSDLASQTKRVLAKMVSQVQAMGLTASNIVKVTVLLVCPKSEFPVFNKAWTEFWGTAFPPCRRAHGVTWVPGTGTLIEVDPIVVRFPEEPTA
ncbi:MAG: RidA family protein [Patescibacteria group bacterium]|nr:RidA family protein [Patescibacteria group bacterium]